MPHIKPASPQDKAAYRKGLPRKLRGTFDRLAEALANPRYELDWYHQVGTLVPQLKPEQPTAGSSRPSSSARSTSTPKAGGYWLKGLAGALNVSPELLVKASRFAELYPRK